MQLTSGSIIKGYKVTDYLTEGGMGGVYRAFQETAGREVAIKVILPKHANTPDFIRRFEAEAQVIARLEHPYIVPLYDYWRDPNGAYLVMRLLRGGSLKDLIRQQGALSVEDAVLMIDHICQALHKAHRNQVIHRDIKPGNILLDEDGNAYLADFGIAKDHATVDEATNAEVITGTPEYLSPEQARSEPVTPQTDIYSLGVVLYEMLAGEHPFPNSSQIQHIFNHLNESLPEIITLADGFAAEINDVIQKATAKDPSHRYDDALAFSMALREAAGLDRTPTPVNMIELLTPREQEVIKLIVEGKTNRQIAETLVVEVSTVKWYVKQIYKKLGVRSRVQAILKARDLDLIYGKPDAVSIMSLSHLPEPDNPYKGLEAFQAGDEYVFFGREKLTKKLLARLEEKSDYQRFLALVGPSGSGKSSVVRAGLIPAIWRGDISGSENWYIIDMMPGSRPLDELEVALYRIAGESKLNLREQLERDEHGLVRVTDMILPDDGSQLLLVIDQFEEVFTVIEEEAKRQHFLSLIIAAIAAPRSRVRIVVTIRADYYDRPLQHPEFGVLIRDRVETILPLSAEELERAINEPAYQVGVSFEDGLVSRIVSDVHYQPGALPLLQYALTELFEHRDGRNLTLQAYQDIGGTGGALAKRADELFLEGDEERQALIKQMFLRLVTLGEGAEDTRRRVERAELLEITNTPDLMDDIIDVYALSRLLSLDHDPATRQPTVQVAHEAILREWDRLRQWLNDSREDIRQEREIAQNAQRWQESSRNADFLLRGSRLEQAEQWQANTEIALTPLEVGFIQQSINKREADNKAETERQAREAGLERRSRNFLRGLVAVMAIGLLIAGVLVVVANNERNNAILAQQDTLAALDVAQRSGLAFAANSALDHQEHDLAIALAVESAKDGDELLPESLRVLERISTEIGPKFIVDNQGHRCGNHSNDDGHYVLTWDCNGGHGIIWDATTGEPVQEISEPAPFSRASTISSDNRYIYGFDWNAEMTVWDRETGDLIHSFDVNPDQESIWLWGRTWDPRLTSIARQDESVRELNLRRTTRIDLYNMLTGEIDYQFEFADIFYNLFEFSSDGTLGILSGWADNETRDTYRVYIFEVATGEIIETYERPAVGISPDTLAFEGGIGPLDIGFSDDNSKIFIGGYPNYVIDRATNQDVLTDDTYPLMLAAATTLSDKMIIQDPKTSDTSLLDTNTGEITFLGVFHLQLSYSPDRQILITGMNHDPGHFQVWDLNHRNSDAKLISTDTAWKNNAFSPDGKFLATVIGAHGSPNPYLQIVDLQTGEQVYRLDNEGVQGYDLAWSPDGSMIAVGTIGTSDGGTLLIIDAFTYETIHRLNSDEQHSVATMQFTADSRYLVSAKGIFDPSAAYNVEPSFTVWDTETGNLVNQIMMPPGDELENWGIIRIRLHPTQPIAYTVVLESWNQTQAYLVDISTGEILHKLDDDLAGGAVFTQDGDLVIGSYNGKISVVSTETAEIIRQWDSVSGGLLEAIDLSADEKYLAVGSNEVDSAVSLWNFETGQLIRRYIGNEQQSGIPDVDFSPDGTLLAYTDGAGSQLRTLDTTSTLDWVLENRAVRDFTCAERELYRIEPLCEPEE